MRKIYSNILLNKHISKLNASKFWINSKITKIEIESLNKRGSIVDKYLLEFVNFEFYYQLIYIF